MKFQLAGDKFAIGLSLLCVLHCLALPLFIILFPSIAYASVSDELFHQLMLLVIVPVSLAVLVMGMRHHKDITVFTLGLVGLFILTCTALIDHKYMSAWLEVGLTVSGSLIIAYAHFRNARVTHLFKSKS